MRNLDTFMPFDGQCHLHIFLENLVPSIKAFSSITTNYLNRKGKDILFWNVVCSTNYDLNCHSMMMLKVYKHLF